MFKKLLESIRDFWHNHELYTPVSEMTKADIENIINRIKEKEELISKSNNCNNCRYLYILAGRHYDVASIDKIGYKWEIEKD